MAELAGRSEPAHLDLPRLWPCFSSVSSAFGHPRIDVGEALHSGIDNK
jgi:hypothetical protein